MKGIKYEFFKMTKVKDKLTKYGHKNQILRQFFAKKLLVMFLTYMQNIIQKLKSLSINKTNLN